MSDTIEGKDPLVAAIQRRALGIPRAAIALVATCEIPRREGYRRGRIILARIREDEDPLHHFVVAHQFSDGDLWDSEWAWGHYRMTEGEAFEKFIELVKKDRGLA